MELPSIPQGPPVDTVISSRQKMQLRIIHICIFIISTAMRESMKNIIPYIQSIIASADHPIPPARPGATRRCLDLSAQSHRCALANHPSGAQHSSRSFDIKFHYALFAPHAFGGRSESQAKAFSGPSARLSSYAASRCGASCPVAPRISEGGLCVSQPLVPFADPKPSPRANLRPDECAQTMLLPSGHPVVLLYVCIFACSASR